MAEQDKRSEALGVAIQMEKEGIGFYTRASEQHSHPFGKKMFASLAKDEERHVAIFQEMAAAAGVRPSRADELDQEGPLKRMNAIFREVGKQVAEAMSPSDDDIKVIGIAKEMEQKAYAFYTETADQATDDEEAKAILRKIALEENEHYRILEDTRLYLTDPAEWNLKEEKPLIDGG